MVKKFAVTTIGVVAILLALSPLASARPGAHHLLGPDRNVDDGIGGDQFGLVSLNNLHLLNGNSVCPDVGANVGGILGLLGTRGGGDETGCAGISDD